MLAELTRRECARVPGTGLLLLGFGERVDERRRIGPIRAVDRVTPGLPWKVGSGAREAVVPRLLELGGASVFVHVVVGAALFSHRRRRQGWSLGRSGGSGTGASGRHQRERGGCS